MSTLGSLTIEMAADIARLRSDMDGARRVVGGAMADIQRAANVARTAMGLLGGALSVGAMSAFARETINGIDALNDMADATGSAIEKIAAIERVARQTGTALDTPTTAIIKLNAVLNDLSPTSGGALVLKQLGLDAAALRNQDPSDTLVDVARAFAKFEDDGNKARAMQELLGKSVREVAPLLKDLAERGAEVSPVTKQMAEEAEKFNQQLAAMQTHSSDVARSMVGDLLPALNGVLDKLKTQGFGATVLDVLGFQDVDYAAPMVTAKIREFNQLSRALKEAQDAMRADPLNPGVGRWQKQVEELVPKVEAARKAMQEAQAFMDELQRPKEPAIAASAAAPQDRPTLKVANPEDIKAAADAAKAYAELIAKIKDKTAAEKLELQTGQSLTEAQKLQIEIASQLQQGKLKLSAASRAAVAAAIEELRLAELARKFREQEKAERDERLKKGEAEIGRIRDQVKAQKEANEQIGKSAIAIAMLEAARLDEKAAAAEEQAFWAEGSTLGEAVTEQYREQARLLRELAQAKRAGASAEDELRLEQERLKVVDAYLKRDIGTNFAAGFDAASQSLGVFVQTFSRLIEEQDKYNEARAAAVGNAEKLAAIEARHQAEQINTYGSLAGAAKGFFKEGSKGYKGMAAAEKAFRAIELAMAVETALVKIGLIESVTAAKLAGDAAQTDSLIVSAGKQVAAFFGIGTAAAASGVANQANGDPYTAFPRMAAMAAIMAGLGFATGAFGGGGGSFAATNTGTGTVLGDSSAQSESIAKAIELLKDVDTMTMRYSAQMLVALQSIESNISGLTALLVRSGGLEATVAGVETGVTTSKMHSTEAAATRAALAVYTLGISEYLGLGSAIERLANRTMGTVKSIAGQGVYGAPQSVGEIAANGYQAQYYADVESKRKFLGMTTSTRRDTQYFAADAELERQFTLILTGFADAVQSAAGPLGVSLNAVQSRLASFVVDIGRIDLQGLTGDQINEKLTAVFGAAGDNIAQAALPGFEAFQKIGEGYLETIVRVASGVEEATALLKRLGVSAVSLTAIEAKQGDVAAELVRESVQAAEGLNGISEILGALDGTASELSETYKALTDIRTSLQLLGMSGAAVGYDLLSGAGGLQALADGVAAFEEGFLSDAEQTRNDAARLAEQFKALGLALPGSADEFVALVRGIDTSTAAGQSLLGSLLNLSSGFADLLSAIQETGSGIADEIERIKGLTGGDAMTYSQLQARFAIQTAAARAGDQSAIDALPGLSQDLLEAASNSATTSTELARVQAATLASLEATLALIRDPSGLLSSVPGFAAGGLFGGGLRLVGENGPELEVTGPARYFSAAQTSGMLTGQEDGTLLEELRGLRGEVAMLRTEVVELRQQSQAGDLAVAANTGKLARMFERTMTTDDALRVATDGTTVETTAV